MTTLFHRISVCGLTNEVIDLVGAKRPGVSRNTVHLALKDERPGSERTPLRNYIREVAEEVLKNHENKAAAEAA